MLRSKAEKQGKQKFEKGGETAQNERIKSAFSRWAAKI